jgi:hypothetical protein
MTRADTLTAAYRDHILAMPSGAQFTFHDTWIFVQTHLATKSLIRTHNGVMSCRDIARNLLRAGWLVLGDKPTGLERTAKAAHR